MPAYLIHQPTWETLWPLLLLPVIIALLAFFFSFKSENRLDTTVICLGFSSLGLVVGYLTCLSREPAIGNLIPGALSLVGALSMYIIGKSKESRLLISLAIFIFSISILFGASWGSVSRIQSEMYFQSKEYLMKKALKDKEVDDFKKALSIEVNAPKK